MSVSLAQIAQEQPNKPEAEFENWAGKGEHGPSICDDCFDGGDGEAVRDEGEEAGDGAAGAGWRGD